MHSQLSCKPWLRLSLLAAAAAMQFALTLLLLASLLRHAQGQLLLCVAGLLGCTMLQRLLVLVSQPQLKAKVAHAAGLQAQLRLLADCAVRPLGVPHSSWTLAFEDARLEGHYRKVSSLVRCVCNDAKVFA